LSGEAVGWSRAPLHRCNLGARWGRRKRWDYWAVSAAHSHLLSITYANLDYLGLVTIAFLDVVRGAWLEHAWPIPLALGFDQPDTVGGGDIHCALPGLRLTITEESTATRLRGSFRNVRGRRLEFDVSVALPPGHETLSVVIPWSRDRFQFTSKHNTRPAAGWVLLDGVQYRFDASNDSFGCLDYGRGRWPHRTHWNWASASGTVNGRVIGLQFGGKWTNGTGMTENGVCVDGRLSKIGEEIIFDYDTRDFRGPWRLRGAKSAIVDLLFEPAYEKRLDVNLLVGAAKAHIYFGTFSGEVRTESAERIVIPRLFGWAEEMLARW
jgi:hypothetical protein